MRYQSIGLVKDCLIDFGTTPRYAGRCNFRQFIQCSTVHLYVLITKKNRFLLLISLLVLVIPSCEKDPALFEINNLSNNEVIVLGHRGMGSGYKHPGNTYEGIIPVLGIGADGAEIDVQMTKDSVLILYHDLTMDALTTCTEHVYDYEYAEIASCEYHALVQNVYVPSIESLFDRIKDVEQYNWSFDCRPAPEGTDEKAYYKTMVRAMKRLTDKYDNADKIYVEGERLLLQTVENIAPTYKTFVTLGEIQNTIDYAVNIGAYGIGSGISKLSKEDVTLAHQNNLRVMMWGMLFPNDNLKALQKNPDIVQTDRPMHMLKLFSRYNYDYRIP